MNNEPQRPRREQVDTGRAPQRRVDIKAKEGTTRESPRRERNHTSSQNTAKIELLRNKIDAYKMFLISVLAFYVITILLGAYFYNRASVDVERYKNELEFTAKGYEEEKSEIHDFYNGKISELESELEDNRAYTSALSQELEESGTVDVSEFENQISSLKKKNKEYEKKIKSYKEKINSYKSKIEEYKALVNSVPTSTPEPELSLEYQNALERAKTFSEAYHYSKSRVYEELTDSYDNFSPEAAQYAVDTLFG